jgi:formate dehydrogenase major subunit/formate dehydrogenase-N alpha subunit
VPQGCRGLDYIHSDQRLKYPEVREAGSNEWKRISWDEANERIARLLKDDRDANFIEKNDKGQRVNRWLSTGMLASSAASNETGILDFRFGRALGMVGFDCQARLCHGPTVSALAPSFGRGAMTNHWVDIKNANVILVMGGNPPKPTPWASSGPSKPRSTTRLTSWWWTRASTARPRWPTSTPPSVQARRRLSHGRGQLPAAARQDPARIRQGLHQCQPDRARGLWLRRRPVQRLRRRQKAYDKSSWTYERNAEGHALTDESCSTRAAC